MSAGAFSDPRVLKAAEGVTCIFVDCDWGKKNRKLSDRFEVRGYPTICIVQGDGARWGTLPPETDAIIHYLREVTGQPPVAPDVPPEALPKTKSYEESLPAARRRSMPILLCCLDDSPASQSIQLAFADPEVKKALARFMLVRRDYRRGEADLEAAGVLKAPTLLWLDTAMKDPMSKPVARIEGSRSARELLRDLGEAPAATPGPAAPSDPKPQAEPLSDDEVDRRFIQARLASAIEWLKKGRKDKAVEICESLLKTFPNHVASKDVKAVLEEARK